MYRKQEEEKLPTLKCELISEDRKAEICINSGIYMHIQNRGTQIYF